jgi:hypothetical protein
MGRGYQCWWRICREINVFTPRFEYHRLYVLYPFLTYFLTPLGYLHIFLEVTPTDLQLEIRSPKITEI